MLFSWAYANLGVDSSIISYQTQGKDLSFFCNLDFCTKRLSAHEKRVLYTWTSEEIHEYF